MDIGRIATWDRFCEQVLHQTDWPRDLWLAAVGDALAAALPAGSDLLEDYRRDVDELIRLERLATGSYHDEQRIEELQNRIQDVIRVADGAIRAADGAGRAPVDETAAPPVTTPGVAARWAPSLPSAALITGHAHSNRFAWIAGLTIAAVMFAAGVLGGTYFHRTWLSANADRQLEQIRGAVDDELGALKSELASRIAEVERVGDRVELLHGQLAANVDAFGVTMAESVNSIMALSDNAITDLETRLTVDIDERHLFERLQQRAAALDQGLDDISDDLAGLERGIPAALQTITRVEAEAGGAEEALKQTSTELTELQGQASSLRSWLDHARQEFAEMIEASRGELGTLDGEIAGLTEELSASRGRFAELEDAERAVAGATVAADAAAVDEARIEMIVTATQAKLDGEVDRILTELVERADLAVLRAEDVTTRAEAEALRRVKSEGADAIEAVAVAREQQLSELANRAAAGRTELEQTRAGLVTSWRQLDQTLASRQQRVLDDFDTYAQTIEGNVEELLQAIDVMVAQSELPPDGATAAER